MNRLITIRKIIYTWPVKLIDIHLGHEEHRRLPQQWRRRRGTVRTVRRASRM